MGSFSIGHCIVVLAVVVLVFGAGRLPGAMRDLARGVKSFQKGLRDEDDAAASDPKTPSKT